MNNNVNVGVDINKEIIIVDVKMVIIHLQKIHLVYQIVFHVIINVKLVNLVIFNVLVVQ